MKTISVFLSLWRLQLRRLARRPLFWLPLFLLPFLVGGAALLAGEEREEDISIGIVAPDTPLAKRLVQGLAGRWDGWRFYPAADERELTARVAAGEWECGYLLQADFDTRLQSGRGRLIQRVDSAATSLGAIADELVGAALFELAAPLLAAEVLDAAGYPEAAFWPAEAEAPAPALTVEVETLAGQAVGRASPVRQGLAALLQGTLALLLQLAVALGFLWYGRDRASGFYSRLPGSRGVHAGAFVCAAFLPTALGAALAFALMGVRWQIHTGPAPLILYLFYLAGYTLLLTALLPNEATLLPVLVLLVPASLVLCPIVWDVSALFPAVGPLPWLLAPTAYLRVVAGALPAGALVAAGIVLAACGLALHRLRGRRRGQQ